MRFRDRHGAPLSVPVSVSGTGQSTKEVQQYLPLYTTQVVEIESDEDTPEVAGSAELAPDPSQPSTPAGLGDAVEVIRWNGTGQEIAVAAENRDAANVMMPFDHTSGNQALVAITNRTGAMSTVRLNLRDETGALLQSDVLDIAGHGQSWLALPDVYPITQGIRGTIEFRASADRTMNVFGLRATPGGVMSVIPLLTDR